MRVSRQYLLVIVAIIALASAGAVSAAQVVVDYTDSLHVFKVCALTVSGTGSNQHPLIFEGLRRCPLKPAGWDFENPLAGLDPATNMVWGKSTADYWVVPFTNANASRLVDMDLIYICQQDIAITTEQQREALADAVRNGAVLWIDQYDVNGTGTTVTTFKQLDVSNGPDVAHFQFTTSGPSGDVRVPVNDAAWILRYPFNISREEARYIGRYPLPGMDPDQASVDAVENGTVEFDCQPILSVAGNWNATYTPYGAGALVVTAGEVGWDLESWWRDTGEWWTADNLRRPSRYQAPDFKFAYNILASGSRWSGIMRGASATAKSTAEIRPPLTIDWQFPGRFEARGTNKIGPVVSSPVCSDGMVYAISLASPNIDGDGAVVAQLLAFDADPAQDLDGDGTADDGISDYSHGTPYDLVWRVPLAGVTPRYSSPCVADLYDFGGVDHQRVVLISVVEPNGGAGRILCYKAEPSATATLIWERDIDGYRNSSNVVDLSTPVVNEGYVYVLASEYDPSLDGPTVHSTYGRAHCFALSYDWDADDDGPKWVFPDPTNDPAGDGDVAGPGAGNDNATPELQNTLPPFHEPQWVAGIDDYDNPSPRPELPPTPGCVPVVASDNRPGEPVHQAAIYFGTPVSRNHDDVAGFSGGAWDVDIAGWTGLTDRSGGCDFAIVPTPTGLNDDYYSVEVHDLDDWNGGMVRIARLDAAGNETDIDVDSWTQGVIAANAIGLQFTSGEARELLLPADVDDGKHPWTCMSEGVRLRIDYDRTSGVSVPEEDRPVVTLRGPVLFYKPLDEDNARRVASSTVAGPETVLAATDVAEDADRTLNADVWGGGIIAYDRTTGKTKWSFQTGTTLPNRTASSYNNPDDYAALVKSSPAFDAETNTAVVAVTHAHPDTSAATAREGVSSVIGIGTEADIRVKLVVGSVDAAIRAGTVEVRTLNAGYAYIHAEALVDDTAYTVDADSQSIIFDRERAGWIDDTVGAIYGKPIWVTYDYVDAANPGNPDDDTHVTDELHVLPDVVRFQYAAGGLQEPAATSDAYQGFVRLGHNMVGVDNLNVYLPNGRQLPGVAAGDQPITHGLPGGWSGALPRGIIDVSALQIPTAQAAAGSEDPMYLQPGSEIVVEYYYFDEATRSVKFARETHQIPYQFGESMSSPAVAGHTVHVGTEGFNPTRDNALYHTEPNDAGAITGAPNPQKPYLTGDSIGNTLLSLVWNPVTKAVKGYLATPAIPERNSYAGRGFATVTSSPAVGANKLYVGSKLAAQIPQAAADPAYASEGLGFVSALKPQSTYICDDTRILEVVGNKPVKSWHGTLTPMPNESVDSRRGIDERIPQPFNRLAKAVELSNGNLLVVDTGNNRVVEIDRDGVVKWPLTPTGYDHYSAPDNQLYAVGETIALKLNSPSDVYRYYTIDDGDTRYYSTNGGLLDLYFLEGRRVPHPVTAHTVIADAGNARVIDVITRVDKDADGTFRQHHEVKVVTPSHVKTGAATSPLQRIEYTTVRPIFDPSGTPTPNNEVHPVIGYLCAASNLHQLVVIEAGTKVINPYSISTNAPDRGTAGSNWKWLAWLWEKDVEVTDANYQYLPPDPLIFRNIRDVETSYEGGVFYITVTCGQYTGRKSDVEQGNLSSVAGLGEGVFEFAVDTSGAPGTWRLIPAVDDGGTATPNTPIWYMTRQDYIFSILDREDPDNAASQVRRDLSNLHYEDVDGNSYWQTLPWFPVSAKRLPSDQRWTHYIYNDSWARYSKHLVVNSAGIIPNLTSDSSVDDSAPASLASSIMVVTSSDGGDQYPENDVLDIDRRLVVPDPNGLPWPDPLSQPTHAAQ